MVHKAFDFVHNVAIMLVEWRQYQTSIEAFHDAELVYQYFLEQLLLQ
jgi:hypothetical protein